jgi:hypothetical protein
VALRLLVLLVLLLLLLRRRLLPPQLLLLLLPRLLLLLLLLLLLPQLLLLLLLLACCCHDPAAHARATCCSWTSDAPAHVSVPCTLPPTAPVQIMVQMLCPRPHANIRFHYHLLTPIRSLASLAPPFRRVISVRDDRVTKPQDG